MSLASLWFVQIPAFSSAMWQVPAKVKFGQILAIDSYRYGYGYGWAYFLYAKVTDSGFKDGHDSGFRLVLHARRHTSALLQTRS